MIGFTWKMRTSVPNKLTPEDTTVIAVDPPPETIYELHDDYHSVRLPEWLESLFEEQGLRRAYFVGEELTEESLVKKDYINGSH